MFILYSILLFLISVFLLNIIITLSNNVIFLFFRKPLIWIVFMGLLSFLWFFMGSSFNNSFDIVWWSAFIVFLLNIPPNNKDMYIAPAEISKIIDDMYIEMGIKNGRLKYRLGLIAFVVGGIVGWYMFY